MGLGGGGCCIVYLQKGIVKSAAVYCSCFQSLNNSTSQAQNISITTCRRKKIAEEKHNKFLVFLWFGLHCKFCNPWWVTTTTSLEAFYHPTFIGKTRIFGKFLDGGGVVYVCVYNFKVNYFLLTTFDILKKLVNPIWNFVKIHPIW